MLVLLCMCEFFQSGLLMQVWSYVLGLCIYLSYAVCLDNEQCLLVLVGVFGSLETKL